MTDDKIVCEICGWKGRRSQRLIAQNPFLSMDEIAGCPECKGIDQFLRACNIEGCWTIIDGGTPTTGGYVFHCHKHYPSNAKSIERT